MKHRGRHVWEYLEDNGVEEIWRGALPGDEDNIIRTIFQHQRCKKCGKEIAYPHIISIIRK